jgi:hypothetical protein
MPYLIDASKYLRAFGGTPTPSREGLRRTVAWYRGRLAGSTPSP